MKIKAIKKYNKKCVVHNIGVVDDESYVVEKVKVKNCRGIWVEILKDEEELPKITGAPKVITDRFDKAVNELIQPKKPIVKKSSAAAKMLKK